jgi:carotenoid cleavage dioxygenase-like enzyme
VWIVSYHAARLFTGDQAITAMVIAERRAAAYRGDYPFTSGWREELDV